MIAISKLTIFCLALLISTMPCAQPQLEIESSEIDDPNTKKLTDNTIFAGTVFFGLACCNRKFDKAEPYSKGKSLQVYFHMPLGSQLRVWLQDQRKIGRVICNEEKVGCVHVPLLAKLGQNLDGISVKNHCTGLPGNRLIPDKAYIGFSVLQGSIKVDGIEEPFTCDEIPKTPEGSKKSKRARRSD